MTRVVQWEMPDGTFASIDLDSIRDIVEHPPIYSTLELPPPPPPMYVAPFAAKSPNRHARRRAARLAR